MCDQSDDFDEDFVIPNDKESEEETEKEIIKHGPIQNTDVCKAVKG